eukprot:g16457.t1
MSSNNSAEQEAKTLPLPAPGSMIPMPFWVHEVLEHLERGTWEQQFRDCWSRRDIEGCRSVATAVRFSAQTLEGELNRIGDDRLRHPQMPQEIGRFQWKGKGVHDLASPVHLTSKQSSPLQPSELCFVKDTTRNYDKEYPRNWSWRHGWTVIGSEQGSGDESDSMGQ